MAFVSGFIVSCFWAVFLVPVYLVKKSFAMPFDS